MVVKKMFFFALMRYLVCAFGLRLSYILSLWATADTISVVWRMPEDRVKIKWKKKLLFKKYLSKVKQQ